MKNVGIVTLFGEYNFGNRLQNYAVQQVLKKNGFNTETMPLYTGYLQQSESPYEQVHLDK